MARVAVFKTLPVVAGSMETDKLTVKVGETETEVSYEYFEPANIADAIEHIGEEEVLEHIRRSVKGVFASKARANALDNPQAKVEKAAAKLVASGLSIDDIKALLDKMSA